MCAEELDHLAHQLVVRNGLVPSTLRLPRHSGYPLQVHGDRLLRDNFVMNSEANIAAREALRQDSMVHLPCSNTHS